ncbi:hypothetical protein RFI_22218, partial [Reticulomyxa filosa]
VCINKQKYFFFFFLKKKKKTLKKKTVWRNGSTQLYGHFAIPIKKAWDNVHHFCGTSVVFENEEQKSQWCVRHGYDSTTGHFVKVEDIYNLAKVWYGKHLDPDWKKWTLPEAFQIFQKCGMTHPIWELPIEHQSQKF